MQVSRPCPKRAWMTRVEITRGLQAGASSVSDGRFQTIELSCIFVCVCVSHLPAGGFSQFGWVPLPPWQRLPFSPARSQHALRGPLNLASLELDPNRWKDEKPDGY